VLAARSTRSLRLGGRILAPGEHVPWPESTFSGLRNLFSGQRNVPVTLRNASLDLRDASLDLRDARFDLGNAGLGARKTGLCERETRSSPRSTRPSQRNALFRAESVGAARVSVTRNGVLQAQKIVCDALCEHLQLVGASCDETDAIGSPGVRAPAAAPRRGGNPTTMFRVILRYSASPALHVLSGPAFAAQTASG
jgi:hypothetical protein